MPDVRPWIGGSWLHLSSRIWTCGFGFLGSAGIPDPRVTPDENMIPATLSLGWELEFAAK